MAQIVQHNGGGIITWGFEDWISGLDPSYPNTFTLNVKSIGNAQAFDPYRFPGYASPGYNPTDLTNVSVIDALQLNAVVKDTFAYSIGGTKLHQITILTNTITTPTTFPHSITGATAGQDVVVYPIKNGSTTRSDRLLYSWKDGSNGNIGIYDFVTTFDDDWLSTIPTSAATFDTTSPHNFIIGVDDICYVTDGNNIHAIDGNGGTAAATQTVFSKNVFTIPKGYIAVGFARIEPRSLVIFAYRDNSGGLYYQSRSTAFFWDYLSLDPYKIVELNDNAVGAPFEWNGMIGCFTEGRPINNRDFTKDAKLKIWNGNVFETKVNFIGSIPSIGGVDIQGNQIMWNCDGEIFAYGNNFEYPIVFNKTARPTGSTNGLLKTISSILQMVSSGTTTSGGLQSLNSNYAFGCLVQGNIAKPQFPMRHQGQVKRVRVSFKGAVSSGLGFTLSLVNQDGVSSTIFSSVTSVVSGSTVLEREKNTSGNSFPLFERLRMTISYDSGTALTDAPIVQEVQVEYEYKIISSA